jgi:hypothetical protein
VASFTGMASDLPLAGYRWSADPVPVDSVGDGKERLHTDAARVEPGQEIRASWRDVEAAAADDWIGLFAEDGPDEADSEPVPTPGGSSGSVPLEIPPNVAPGRYELRMFGGGWKRLATSPSFEVLPSTASVQPVGGPFRAGATITVAWSGVLSPKPDDWIGVFPIGDDAWERRAPAAVRWPGVASAGTGGAAAGTVRVKVPANVRPGRYQLRLFTKGGELRATSPAFRLRRHEPR